MNKPQDIKSEKTDREKESVRQEALSKKNASGSRNEQQQKQQYKHEKR
ncbi:hypothetical protein NO559_03705 [Dasania sp. GY-MA-18]|uniref:Uncharacterized protein n=1 Tax=Dasania phycosphaerae TaxID=2950436 RepID=A0A9J6RIJ9_9GAMM|nr:MULTISPECIES: hypothetical protein [Dasania]MCR8921863.1 hypothetical protein [Dasania sp. GY-MA-18]MCZ0864291.1 hypothetical protein [Dasania phycosphaerae]MCZ0868019.1 hypothetical protein [Dasania phycosphaerae]